MIQSISIDAQPGYQCKPVYLWIMDGNRDVQQQECNPRFQVFANMISEHAYGLMNNGISSGIGDSENEILEELACIQDTIVHFYYDHNKRETTGSYREVVAAFYHPSVVKGESCFLKGLIIVRDQKDTMFIDEIPLYLLKDPIDYSHGNWVDIPHIIIFREGSFNFDFEPWEWEKVELEKYKERTKAYHQLPEDILPVPPKPKFELKDVNMNRAGMMGVECKHFYIRLANMKNQPIEDATVTADYRDGISRDLHFIGSDETHAIYELEESLSLSLSPIYIQQVSIHAKGFLTELVYPRYSINEVFLVQNVNDYVRRDFHTRIPIIYQDSLLMIYFPKMQSKDTMGFSFGLSHLGLYVDTSFFYCCGGVGSNALGLRRRDASTFGHDTIYHMEWLRQRFPAIRVCPAFKMKLRAEDVFTFSSFPMASNVLLVEISEEREKALKMIAQWGCVLGYDADYASETLKLPLGWGLSKINETIESMASSGLFISAELQFEQVFCPD